MRKRFIALSAIWLSTAHAQPPTLTMHIFDQPPAEPQKVVQRAAPSNDPLANMVVFADDEPAPDRSPVREISPRDFVFSYDIATGYQHDSLNWSVASPSGTPNPITEVSWQDINLTRLQTGFDIVTPSGFAVQGAGSYGWLTDSTGQEQPYGSPAQIGSNSQGYAWQGSLGAGYRFKVSPTRNSLLTITPLAGYSWQRQKNRLAQNRYTSDWEGPWLGMDVALSLFEHHSLFSSVQYHWADYTASADWQSASGLQPTTSFLHNATATGLFASAGYRYRFSNRWGMKLAVDYQKWQTDTGNEQLFSNGTTIHSTLNRVQRESMGVNVGLNYAF